MKLDLGAGSTKEPGWTTIDLDPKTKPDTLGDITHLTTIPDNSCEAIRCIHSLEHVYEPLILPTLKLWYLKLKPNGLLILYLPDVRKDWKRFLTTNQGEERLLTITYGKQYNSNPLAVHKTAFWPERIRCLLLAAGFSSTSPLPPRYDTEFGIQAIKPPP